MKPDLKWDRFALGLLGLTFVIGTVVFLASAVGLLDCWGFTLPFSSLTESLYPIDFTASTGGLITIAALIAGTATLVLQQAASLSPTIFTRAPMCKTVSFLLLLFGLVLLNTLTSVLAESYWPTGWHSYLLFLNVLIPFGVIWYLWMVYFWLSPVALLEYLGRLIASNATPDPDEQEFLINALDDLSRFITEKRYNQEVRKFVQTVARLSEQLAADRSEKRQPAALERLVQTMGQFAVYCTEAHMTHALYLVAEVLEVRILPKTAERPNLGDALGTAVGRIIGACLRERETKAALTVLTCFHNSGWSPPVVPAAVKCLTEALEAGLQHQDPAVVGSALFGLELQKSEYSKDAPNPVVTILFARARAEVQQAPDWLQGTVPRTIFTDKRSIRDLAQSL